MAGSDAGEALEREIRIAARPETVFSYFTDPQKMQRWQAGSAALDPRPGGVFRLDITPNDVARGEYREVQPYSRLVFTWGWEGENHPLPPGRSTVEITFEPDGDGTILRLRHYDLPRELRDSHGLGWDHYLPRLQVAAAGGDPGIDPWLDRANMPF